jgi:hypothetical protein
MNISKWEYNVISNEYAVYERALVLLMDERGVDELRIGNVYLYRADGGGVSGWFVDENGDKLKSVDYAFGDKGENA